MALPARQDISRQKVAPALSSTPVQRRSKIFARAVFRGALAGALLALLSAPALAQSARLAPPPAAEPAVAAPTPAANSAAPQLEPEFRTLGLRQAAAGLATDGYDGFYCGSDGGPPLQAIRGWSDYARCQPDHDGLHEVDVTFGSKIERMAHMFQEQYGQQLWIQKYGGTRVANFPVVMSLLFDAGGVARGFRVVTNPAADRLERANAYLLRFRVYALYGDAGWHCDRRGPSDGRTPVGEMYIDETCTKNLPGKRVRVEAHLFRRPGETGTDETGEFMAGEFESSTRWEVFDATLPPTREERGDQSPL